MPWLGAARAHEAQIGTDRQFEKVRPQEPRREEQDLQVLNLAGIGVQARDYFVRQFLRFLLPVGRAFVDVEDVRLPVVLEGQLRFYSGSPSASFLAR